MEGLKKWKINYLSPSSIATFIENPAMYVMEKIFNYRFKGNASASRGTFIERGVNQVLSRDDIDPIKVSKAIVQDFINECEQYKYPKEDIDKELFFIEKAIQVLPAKLKQFGKVVGYQKEVGYDYKGVHLKGYTDFEFSNNDNLLFIDLKTTGKIPKATTRHKIQQYIYSKATNVENRLFYIQVLKTKEPRIEEYKLTEEDEIMIPLLINQAINNINVLCSLANTKEDWKRLVTPNPDDWKWNDEDKQKARKEIWGY